MNRRHFLQAIGAGAAVTAGGIELLQLAVPKRTFFLPPVGGWRETMYEFGPGMLYLDGWLVGKVVDLSWIAEARAALEIKSMRPAAIEGMIRRCARKMIEADDFGIRLWWMWARERWIRRRAKGR